jgi:HEAT repeat protein
MKRLTVIAATIIFAAATYAQTDQAETKRVIERFKEPSNVRALEGAGWSLAHQYGDIKRAEAVFEFAGQYFEAFQKYGAGETEPLEKLGGVASFKRKVAALVKDTDPGARCYAITLVGVIGDKTMAPQIASFLTARQSDLACERERAMVALGRLNSQAHKTKIAAFLKKGNSNERAAAIRALALLGAKEFAGTVAAILLEQSNTHETAPVQFLIDTGTAASHKQTLLKAMQQPFGGDRSKEAMYALASIDAGEHAADIAALLSDSHRKGDAAKALALMGAKEFSPRIAPLLGDENPLVRSDAVLALGILDAREYSAEIAKVLHDPEEFVRPYAAAAIVLLRLEAYYVQALPHLDNRNSLSLYLIGSSFPSTFKSKVDVIANRALDALDEARAPK